MQPSSNVQTTDVRVVLAVLSDRIPRKEIARIAGVDDRMVGYWLSQEKHVSLKALRKMYLGDNAELSAAVAHWFLGGGPMVAQYAQGQREGDAMAHGVDAMKRAAEFLGEVQAAVADGRVEAHELAAAEQKFQDLVAQGNQTMLAMRAQANASPNLQIRRSA